MVRWQAYGFGHVIEGRCCDAVAQGDKLEALEIVRVVKSRKVECNRSFVGLKGARLKQQAALKQNQKQKWKH
jgi:hypothetical protein